MRAPEKAIASFPWILWYIWKARNDQVFNNRNVPSQDTYQLAIAETEAWYVAQIVERSEEETETSTPIPPIVSNDEAIHILPRCQIDASWSIDCLLCGGGFVIEKEDGNRVYGSTAMYQVLSPFHAELETLSWAMKTSLNLGLLSMHFETDCLQLVKLIEEEEVWPSLASELDEFYSLSSSFISFSISFIPRLMNVRADYLSKEARARGLKFSYVDSMVPRWLAHEASQLVSS